MRKLGADRATGNFFYDEYLLRKQVGLVGKTKSSTVCENTSEPENFFVFLSPRTSWLGLRRPGFVFRLAMFLLLKLQNPRPVAGSNPDFGLAVRPHSNKLQPKMAIRAPKRAQNHGAKVIGGGGE